MPLYDYDCPDCEQTFEKRVSMTDADNVRCPHCGSPHTRRKISRISVKGSSTSAGSSVASVPASGGL